ncbi:hypothetical protein DL98DRAFT_538227 [Cadophora sp. DSE1049]|nr:hypothetical protein DL98DRAFT_538227 [Cadophora sp. DSE1049]
MRFTKLIPLLATFVVADIASYDPELGLVVRIPDLEDRAVNCKVLNGVLSVLKGLGGPATSFCSSYLSIGTATVTSVVTPAPSLVTVVTSVTVTSTTFQGPIPKRAAKPVPIPAALKGFVAAELTSACKCLSIPSKTAQVTITAPTPVNTVTALLPSQLSLQPAPRQVSAVNAGPLDVAVIVLALVIGRVIFRSALVFERCVCDYSILS